MDKLKKKMGRPTDNPRNQRLSLKLTNEEMDMLEFCSTEINEPRVNIISSGIKKVYDELIKESETIREILDDSIENKNYECVEKKVMYQKDGKGSGTYKIPIPKKWIKKIGITEEDRILKITYNDDEDIILVKK